MKRLTLLLILSFSFFFTNITKAQLPDGSIAPDWTLTDINGVSHHLYDYLNAGKTVIIDFSATWCGPCWSYHSSHALETFYENYGPDGTDECMVFFIEGDADTGLDCLYGEPSCPSSQGNWVEGTPYPIINDASQDGPYQIGYWPTIYGICAATKEITEVGQINSDQLYAFHQSCPATSLQAEVTEVTDVACHGGEDGAIDIAVTGGATPYSYSWSSGQSTQDLTYIPAGTYYCTITDNDDDQVVLGPIEVTEPETSYDVYVAEIVAVGCGTNGGGDIFLSASGGTPPYYFTWSNGSHQQNLLGASAGTYSVTTTDDHQCLRILQNIILPLGPTAEIAPPDMLGCNNETVTLDASESTSGPTIFYFWTTSDGHIVSGANSTNPVVDQPGTYTLEVLDDENSCSDFASVTVVEGGDPPAVDAGQDMVLTCTTPTATLQGTGSSGDNLTYLWTTDGGTIVSGETTLNPVVESAGIYCLTITDTSSGCSATDCVTVTADMEIPTVNVISPEVLTCENTTAIIEAFGSSSGEIFTYEWTNEEGILIGITDYVEVSSPGCYTLTVTNTNNGCSNSETVCVEQDIEAPTVTIAQPELLTCTNTGTTLDGTGSSSGENFSYSWTDESGAELDTNLIVSFISSPGCYTLTVTNTNSGCTNSETVCVEQDIEAPTVTIAQPELWTCANTSITLDGTGSSSGDNFTYSWTDDFGNEFGVGNTADVSYPGCYTLTVTNTNNGCANSETVCVEQDIEAPTVTIAQPELLTCANTSITLDGTGSSSGDNFSYLWTTSAGNVFGTGNTADVSIPGCYTLTVTDTNNGCTDSETVCVEQDITEPTAIIQPPAMLSTGQISVTLDGSESSSGDNFTSLWTDENGTQIDTVIITTVESPGDYCLTITNITTGCTATACVTVVPAPEIDPDPEITITPVSCQGYEDGAASIEPTGGTPPYTFEWNTGYTDNYATELAPGTYTVTITDINLSTVVVTFDITEPDELEVNVETTGQTADGANDGTATAVVTGGTPPYTYSWNTGADTPSIEDLAPGYYWVEVLDSHGCLTFVEFTINSFDCNLSILNLFSQEVTCYGGNDGMAFIEVTGGTTPYSYQWSNEATTFQIENLTAGNYSVTVTDEAGCTLVADVDVSQPDELVAEIASTNETGNNTYDGTASVEVSGGTPPYSFLWNTGATTADISNLPPGDYSVAVTDANGCVTDAGVTIYAYECDMTVVINSNNVSCFGAADGSAFATPAGGTPPFSYLWNTGTTSPIINNLEAAFYVVTVTDDAGCSVVENVYIAQPEELSLELNASDETTNDGNDGTATALVTGGTPPYSYLWSTGETTPGIADLAPGIYSVVVTDANDCVIDGEVTVLEFDCTLEVSILSENVSCFGAEDGVAHVLATGGLTPYTYLWSNGETSVSTDNLSPGDYSVTVTDAANCTAIGEVTITQPDELTIELGAIPETAEGANDGVAWVEITGAGTPPYSFLWSNGETVDEIHNLSPGEICVNVTDNNGCTVTGCVTVDPYECTLEGEIVIVNHSCPGECNGVMEVAVYNGTPPYSYEWSIGATEAVITNLCPGDYSVTVTDADDCQVVLTDTIEELPQIVFGVEWSLVNCECYEVEVSGEYTFDYNWTVGDCLLPGTYSVTATDEAGCSAVEDFTLPAIPVITAIEVDTVIDATPGNEDGAIEITVIGGTPPYTYLWTLNGEEISEDEDISNLAAGTYTVQVTTGAGCTASADITVNEVVGTDDLLTDSDIEIIPNPTTGKITVTLPGYIKGDVYFDFFDVTGKRIKVITGKTDENIFAFDLTGVTSGVFFVKITSGQATVTKRIVVEK